MKTKSLIKIIIVLFIFVNSNLKAETIFFDSKNIKIEEEGNMIFATKGIAKIPSKNLIIEGEKFIYDKIKLELIIFDDVKYIDSENNIIIKSQKMIYNESENTIFSQNKTFIQLENNYDIFSSDVLLNRNLKTIVSEQFTEAIDNTQNKFVFREGLIFDTIKEIIYAKKISIKDIELNHYFFENSKLNLKINEIVGKEVKVNFRNSFFGVPGNDPILKGRSVISNNDSTKIYKSVFSTCNKKNKDCRGWELQSKTFKHDKIKKLFEYEKSWLKVFGKRVFWMPYFSHPDPSVKRKSGFLNPSYRGSSNLGSSLTVPYFYSISNSKDFTFKPKIYLDNDYILHAEYREAFKKSNLIADFSLNSKDNTNTHFFAELDGKINDTTSYQMKVQNVTGDNYLKIHEIQDNTSIAFSESTLTSNLSFAKIIDEDTTLDSSIRLYQDLSKEDSDKYQYVFPDFSFSKNIDLDDSYNGNFQFISTGFQKVFDTNIYEAQINNDFNFQSFDYITSTGLLSDYTFLLKNFNTYSENSSVYENKNDHEIFGMFLFKSELPLKKELENSKNFLTPIIQLRISPTNGKNISSDDTRINFDNLFSPNRIGRSDMVEKGESITLGLEFEKQNIDNDKILGLGIGNVLKDTKNMFLPAKTKLNQTRSDIVGNAYYKPNDKVELSYSFSYDRDLDYSNYDAVSAKFGLNKFVTSFDYIIESNDFGNSELINNNTNIRISDYHAINFNTAKDLQDDFTQFYKLSYNYETDCLSASFEYEKEFFRDGSLVPKESLVFLIKFIPFAEIRGSANTVLRNLNEQN